MTIREIKRNIAQKCKISPLDAEILLFLALNKPREYILAHPEKKLTRLQAAKLKNYIKRRVAGEPIAYLTGKKEFYGLEFAVNKNVLIPRPETELLVERALFEIRSRASSRSNLEFSIIDVGTGSGNIIISICKNLPPRIKNKINFFAIDVSSDALRVAKTNAKKHRVDKKIKFIQSDLIDYFLKKKIKTKNLLIVANLPYVSPEIYKKNKNNLQFEPKRALVSAKNGLDHYEKLVKQIKLLFSEHYLLIAEISPEQKSEIGRIIGKYLPKARVRFSKDLAKKWRAAVAET